MLLFSGPPLPVSGNIQSQRTVTAAHFEHSSEGQLHIAGDTLAYGLAGVVERDKTVFQLEIRIERGDFTSWSSVGRYSETVGWCVSKRICA